MRKIAFIDTEVSRNTGKIEDYGACDQFGATMHSNYAGDFTAFLRERLFICGHNIMNHDLLYIEPVFPSITIKIAIDTLYLSPLLFPKRPYHKLVKDDKLISEHRNNPLNDAKKAMDLFHDELGVFYRLDESLKRIYYGLLKEIEGFKGFFIYMNYDVEISDLASEIKEYFSGEICNRAEIKQFINQEPVALAYCLALINTKSRYSVAPPWVLKKYPQAQMIIYQLRNKPCLEGCSYCEEYLDPVVGLKQFFGYDSYRTFDSKPLQEEAVTAAVQNKSMLAVFPTGGGKSITFQVPALMAGRNERGLTVIISPLQSLMKDQVDNLEERNIIDAVTINGLLDPIGRADAFERVSSGTAHLLYISPESLRSRSIERLLLNRKVVRFVIDEAHCFSAWGQDFRVDYLYIGDFIRELCEKKNLAEMIPVSCFTATAKQQVINDIKQYFREKLSVELELFTASSARKNLHYQVLEKKTDAEKYSALRSLIDAKSCPTIIYVSYTRDADSLSYRLQKDGYSATAYHGKMDKQKKSENQDAFIRGDYQVMVATSAFGMGVDKKDVGLVIHYVISNSLENYSQEAGRAGRDQSIEADCYVLYDEEDLNKHFTLLNQTRLNMDEIQKIWKAIKDLTKFRHKVTHSALEIARQAGWDDSVRDCETRVRTAISALENSGYLKRGQNVPHVYADSILANSMIEAGKMIDQSSVIRGDDVQRAKRIISSLLSARSTKHVSDEVAESRIDYLSDYLGIEKAHIIRVVQLLKQENILADAKDLTAFIGEDKTKRGAKILQNIYRNLEKFILDEMPEEETTIHIKELNEGAEIASIKQVTTSKIIDVFNFWTTRGWINRETSKYSKNHILIKMIKSKKEIIKAYKKRMNICDYILDYVYELAGKPNEQTVQFSVLELQKGYNNTNRLYGESVSIDDVEEALLYLSKIRVLKIEGGFLVVYNAMQIVRIELDNKIKYKKVDYQKLEQFYEQKVQQVHIIGEYAHKMLKDYKEALQFVDDYFQIDYKMFVKKYFVGGRSKEMRRTLTPTKFKQLFGELSPAQLSIINDNKSQYIVVAAGPGSGKTRILVHKLASLLLMEDVKHEQLLMVTFSRAAATEFKKRLIDLIGASAHYVEVKTFHSLCFDLLGRIGNIEKSVNIVSEATDMINSGEVEPSRIAKSVLVIDEAQDMDSHEFGLIRALIKQNADMRVIAVGDDDQNIYEFRGSNSKYMKAILQAEGSVFYELIENYRSKRNLIALTNRFSARIPNRMKSTTIHAIQQDLGEIELCHYDEESIMGPMLEKVIGQGLSNNVCILTMSNFEALQVTGFLLDQGIPARLIQNNERFNLYQLDEIRYFLESLDLIDGVVTVDYDVWEKAKHALHRQYAGGDNYELVKQLVIDFEMTNPKVKYVSDLIIFIRESKMEDFYVNSGNRVYVSTMHKAKGREFDQVVVMLDRYELKTPASQRLLYVAMTRAKKRLCIHYNGTAFNTYLKHKPLSYVAEGGAEYEVSNNSEVIDIKEEKIEALKYFEKQRGYEVKSKLVFQLSHKEVFLSKFYDLQNVVRNLTAGDELVVKDSGCYTKTGALALIFSKGFKASLQKHCDAGYKLSGGKVNYIFWWKAEDMDEIRVVLPEVWLEKE